MGKRERGEKGKLADGIHPGEWVLSDLPILLLSVALVIAMGIIVLCMLWYTGHWPGWLPYITNDTNDGGEYTATNSTNRSVMQTGGNLLQNGGFEGGFRYVDGIRELYGPNEWGLWWDPRSARPEWKDATMAVDSRRVRSGEHAAQWFNNYAVHTGGIYQRVTGLQPGSTLTLSGYVQAFSSGKDDFSRSDGRYRMRIGIDPYGGMDPESADVVWSDGGNAVQPYDAYMLITVTTMARSDRATVWVWGQAEWALKHNDAYVDDVALVASGGGAPPPTPGPTPTPCLPCPTPGPGPGSGCDYDTIRGIMREELDRTGLTGDR
jgi:hypothetical protein